MKLAEWINIYIQITDSLDINRNNDLFSSFILSQYINNKNEIIKTYRNKNFYVIGNGPDLKDYLPSISSGVIIVADSALSTFMQNFNRNPDIIVSDLDSNMDLLKYQYDIGTRLIIHSHGDNIDKILKNADYFKGSAIGTTQNIPVKNIYNFFGFTDGDRSAYLANYLNAKSISLIGFDFNNISLKNYYDGNSIIFKKKKLIWAKKLLTILGKERGVNFKEGGIIEM